MGVMKKLMSYFGLMAEEEVNSRQQKQNQVEYEEDEWLNDDNYYSKPLKQKGTGIQPNNVVSLQAVKQNMKLILVEPRTYDETQELADHLRHRRIIVTNLQRMNHEQAKRVVDFLSGTVYAIGGDIQKVGSNIFLCTPDNVEIQGSISEMFQEDYQSRMR